MRRTGLVGRAKLLATVGVALAALLAVGVLPAFAAPIEPTLDTESLQAMLDAAPGGTVPGYLKTILKGSTIENIPVEVLAVTGGSTQDLVLFRATGPEIDAIGGIAQGMSGSPIYVDDGGTDKLIGALSYGDWETIGGLGLATAIDDMSAIEDAYSATSVHVLSSPLVVDGKSADRIVITPDADTAAILGSTGAIVARPLSAMFVGGLSPSSRGFKWLTDSGKARGYQVVPVVTALGVGKEDFQVPFEAGASVAGMAAWGDFWVGGVGTATYTNGESVVAFGHPLAFNGDGGFALANAWVDGVWASRMVPYKIARPGAIRGTIVADRMAGIVGRTDVPSAVSTITANVLVPGKPLHTGTVYMPRKLLGEMWWSEIAPSAVYSMMLDAADQQPYSGTALTTTTVTVGDGTTNYTITRRNIVDSDQDAVFAAVMDVYDIVGELGVVGRNGLAHPEIRTVAFDAVLTPARTRATIVDVKAPNGLKVGSNELRVYLLQHGVVATRTVDVNFTIPEGTPLEGFLSVAPAAGNSYFDMFEEPPMDSSVVDRRSVADAVKELQDAPSNAHLQVSFTAMDKATGKEQPTIEAKVLTPWFIDGRAERLTSRIELVKKPVTISYGGELMVEGTVVGLEKPGTVRVYARYPYETVDRLIATVVAAPNPDPTAETPGADFETVITGATSHVIVTAIYEGTATELAARDSFTAKVRAKVVTATSARNVTWGRRVAISSTVKPAVATGNVALQYYRRRTGTWVTVMVKPVSAGKATFSWAPPKGTVKVRTRYLAGPTNAACSSNIKTLIVR